MNQIDWITEKSFGKYADEANQVELNAFYGVAKSMRDSGMEHEAIAENLKTLYGATPEQVERVQKEVLGKTADTGDMFTKAEVNYRKAPQCVLCKFFIDKGEGQPKTCEIVEGYIKMPDVCDKFEAK